MIGAEEPDPFGLRSAGSGRLRGSIAKRATDILASAIGLFVLAPLFGIVCLAIISETRGKPFFLQRRTGLGGETFVIYKFRTMTVAEDGPEVVQAQRGDQRVTRVGSVLRRTSVDELPQLINVFKGEMSLVGPRPHAVYHDEFYGAQVSNYWRRFATKPGLTGLAQVECLRGVSPDVAHMAARIDRDLAYIDQWTFWLDVRILLRTAMIFAFHEAAY